jgi:L-aminopeptidase/D-esterase-like protein
MTDATLTKAQASKVAAVSHDGMARAIRPVHSLFDGDTIFCLASSHRPVPEDHIRSLFAFNALLAAAADVFADACLDGILAATGRGAWQSYTELAPPSPVEISVLIERRILTLVAACGDHQ